MTDVSRGTLKPGDTIVIHAAAGGVGLIMSQWAKHLGATVIGTVGSDDKAAIARAQDLDPEAIGAQAGAAEIASQYDALTQEAIDRGVFGVPTYIHAGEPYWGQDRLDFLDRALAE